MIRWIRWVLVLPPAIIAALGSLSPVQGQSTDTLSRTDQWRADVDTLTTVLAQRHVAPFAHRDSAAWMRTADRLKRQVADSSDLTVTMGLMQLVAELGDSHTKLVPWLSMQTHGYPFCLRDAGRNG